MDDITDNLLSTTTIIPEVDSRDEYLAAWEVIVLLIIFVITLTGNTLVLLAIYLRRYKGKRQRLTRMHFFIMHLSIADLITGFLNVLPQLAWDVTYRFQGGPILCKVIKFAQPLGSYLSSYVLIATAIDRYHAICYPMSYCKTTTQRSRITVYIAWILSLLLCLPQVFVFSYQEIQIGVWDCWATFKLSYGERFYVTWYSLSVFLLPLCILIFTYVEICCRIWRNREIFMLINHDGQQAMQNQIKNQNTVITKAKINAVKQTLAVVILYIASSTPFIGCQLWATWDPLAPMSSFFTGSTFTIFSLLSSLTGCVNPWIYLTFSYELRIALTKFLRKIIKRNRSTNLELASNNAISNETRPYKRSSLIYRISRYTRYNIYRTNENNRNSI